MLTILVPAKELYNDESGTFIQVKETQLRMEHSLIAIRKWEAKHHKPFLSKSEKTVEEMLDYFRCMTINAVDPNTYYALTSENMIDIHNYINDPCTATTISSVKRGKKRETIPTAEVLYAQMFSAGIPLECEKWPLNQLMMLLSVSAIESGGMPKMSKREIYAQNRALNEARKAKNHTRG